MQNIYLNNLIKQIYYSNSNNKKAIIIKNKKVFKIVKLHNKQTLFNTYKKLYANNFNSNVTFENLKTLNNVYTIKNYLSKYNSIYATAYYKKITV